MLLCQFGQRVKNQMKMSEICLYERDMHQLVLVLSADYFPLWLRRGVISLLMIHVRACVSAVSVRLVINGI